MHIQTLILNGSPRRNGDCAALIGEMQKYLEGHVRMCSSYYDGISPCIDCRYCKTHAGCAITDGMQEIYDCLASYDNVILASPVHYSELSGSLLGMLSRLQTYFCQRHFRGETPNLPKKNGVLILSGAQKGTETRARSTANILFREMNVAPVAFVFSGNTDFVPAAADRTALSEAKKAALLLNSLYQQKTAERMELDAETRR